MPFSLQCTTKGCCKIQIPYIDPATDKVYCSFCDQEMAGITHFIKVQMKSLKQFRQKQQTPFAVKCSKCGKTDCPKLVNNEIVCSGCSKPLDNLTEPFKIILRVKLKSSNDI
jgi:ribosomal protein L34E